MERASLSMNDKYPLAVSGNRRKQLNSANSGRGAEMPPDVFMCGPPTHVATRISKILQIAVKNHSKSMHSHFRGVARNYVFEPRFAILLVFYATPRFGGALLDASAPQFRYTLIPGIFTPKKLHKEPTE